MAQWQFVVSILFDNKKATKGYEKTCKWWKKDYCMVDKIFSL